MLVLSSPAPLILPLKKPRDRKSTVLPRATEQQGTDLGLEPRESGSRVQLCSTCCPGVSDLQRPQAHYVATKCPPKPLLTSRRNGSGAAWQRAGFQGLVFFSSLDADLHKQLPPPAHTCLSFPQVHLLGSSWTDCLHHIISFLDPVLALIVYSAQLAHYMPSWSPTVHIA